jgi:hypothetical protein
VVSDEQPFQLRLHRIREPEHEPDAIEVEPTSRTPRRRWLFTDADVGLLVV